MKRNNIFPEYCSKPVTETLGREQKRIITHRVRWLFVLRNRNNNIWHFDIAVSSFDITVFDTYVIVRT